MLEFGTGFYCFVHHVYLHKIPISLTKPPYSTAQLGTHKHTTTLKHTKMHTHTHTPALWCTHTAWYPHSIWPHQPLSHTLTHNTHTHRQPHTHTHEHTHTH